MQRSHNRIKNLEANLRNAISKGSQNTKIFLDLGRAHQQHYESSHEAENIESAIKHFKSGLEHVPLDETHHAPLAFHLGNALLSRFREKHEVQDLQDAIAFHDRALALRPVGHQDRSISLYKVATARVTSFQELEGNIDDLQEAITSFEQALVLCPAGHPGRLNCLKGLAHALTNRFLKLRETSDVQEAIVYFREVLELSPSGHPDRSAALSSLARGLLNRFRKLGEVVDLQEAISLDEQALRLRPAGHPGRAVLLRNLASALITRFEKLGEVKDLRAAIEFLERGLRLCPDGHPKQAIALEALADALMTRFRNSGGEMQDLDKAIGLYEKVLNLKPTDHPDQSSALDDLGGALFVRFGKQGEMKDLEGAITLLQKALTLKPSDYPGHYLLLRTAAAALIARYKSLQIIRDLHDAIIYYERAFEMCPVGHPGHLQSLDNLAHGLIIRFKDQRNIGDIQKIVDLHERELDLSPPDSSKKFMVLDTLTHVLVMKFERVKNIDDLQKAIMYQEEAINLCPASDPKRSEYLYGLAHALKLRAQHLKEVEDLRKATSLYKQVLELYPDGHPEHPKALNNLATALVLQFKYTGDLTELESARSHYRTALSCLPSDHPFCCSIMSSQASLVMALHETDWVPCQNCSHVDEVCELLKVASNHPTTSLQQRFGVSTIWTEIAHAHKHQSALTAYSTAMELQQQQLFLSPPGGTNPRKRIYSTVLCSEAVSCAIEMGNLETAVQFMEQGRFMLWSTIRQYGHPFEKLLAKVPELAKEFKTIGHQIRRLPSLADIDIPHQHVLYEKWMALLEKVKGIEGFSSYLQATPFKDLKDVAKEGPVIMLSINDTHSNATILTTSVGPIVVPLLDADPVILDNLVQWLSDTTSGIRPSKTIITILQYFWTAIVEPVVKQLSLLQVPEKSHIWWCPISCFSALPLHAAGPYKKGLKNLPDLYISSYTPSLESLIKARESMTRSHSTPNLLLISQPETALPGMLEETKIVERYRKDINIDTCSGEGAHKEAVLKGLQSHSWVHFCCHGHLASHSPRDSTFQPWFQLHDKESLTVLELSKAQLPDAEFAFLSACHSAEKSVLRSPNLYTKLTAALQFSKFKSVVGTLWETVDDNGPVIADAFYKHMFHNAGTVNVKDAAEALNVATREMRKKNVPIDQWINYVHVGI
ncbi:CHAT domain-containing protein [Collybia nuda]|uniref:CHAT domain-containing protein n=1 Tax=Collybia nuda TaxID=64659 RepID=A0A9P6CKH9_9AGAR|nr:CHAT domain-containing protein [Collybia nuda]